MKQFVEFKYTILKKEYLPQERSVIIDLKNAKVIGWKKNDRIWSDYKKGYTEEKEVFYIVQGGAEYGALVTDPSLYRRRDNISEDFQVFEEEFENIFE